MLLRVGAALTLAFLVVRAINHYGDPDPWSAHSRAGFAALSFLNCEKYPPSLDYLLMTLGPALLAWGLATGRDLTRARAIITFGRVPLFYYVLHLPLLHALAGVWLVARGGASAIRQAHDSPHGAGGSLLVVYGLWGVGVVALYPLCRWFDGVKQRHRGAWWTHYT